jgi:peptidoglycan/LPS O-acetylase OafA/YrhL
VESRVLAPSPGEKLGYRPALDGLRALAVVAVLLYHGGVGWASGGFLGVDVFFVLSGFLITTLLVEEWRSTGRLRIGAFYGRRARRLLPPLVPVLVFVAVAAVVALPAAQRPSIRADMLASVGYVMNWRLVAAHQGYFDAFAGLSPLKHAWSLAVEEQWYLVWPVVVGLLLGRRGGRRRVVLAGVVTVALGSASALWMRALASPTVDPSRVYYGTDTRAQELLVGAAVAFACAVAGSVIIRAGWARRMTDVAGLGGLVALAWLVPHVDDGSRWLYEGGMFAISLAVGIIVLAGAQREGVVPRLLSVRPLRYVGLLSYALYLWHFPVYVVASAERTGLEGTSLLLFRLVVSFAAAALSHHLLEAPIRMRRLPLWRVATVLTPAAGLAILVVSVYAANPQVVPVPAPSTVVVASSAFDPSAQRVPAGEVLDGLAELEQSAFDPAMNPVPQVPTPTMPRVVLTGDSVAWTLGYGYDQFTGPGGVALWNRSSFGCSLFPGIRSLHRTQFPDEHPCGAWRGDRVRWLSEFRPEVVAVLSGPWETYDRVLGGRTLSFGSVAHDRWFARHLDAFVEQMAAAGARTVFLTAPCNERPRGITGAVPPENDPKRLRHLNAAYRAAAARHPGQATVIDLAAHVCPGGEMDRSLRAEDAVHFSSAGAGAVRAWLFPQLAASAEQ